MTLTVKNALILALGPVAYGMAEAYRQELRTRHPAFELPTIGILGLLEKRPDHPHPLESLIMGPRPDPSLVEICNRLYPNPAGWPGEPDKLLETLNRWPRLCGQVSLHQHVFSIADRLRSLVHTMLARSTLDRLHQLDMQVDERQEVHVFVLLSLADPFMTGLLPDLPYLIQYVLKEGASQEIFVHIHLVLASPGFKGELELETRDETTRARDEQEDAVWINAWAAACLREVDYYLGWARSRRYYQSFGLSLTIDTRRNPLGNGQIYWLEPASEAQPRLEDVNVLMALVGLWLYEMTATPLRELLEPLSTGRSQFFTHYASFGTSRLFVPLPAWIERMSVQLAMDLIKDVLLVKDVQRPDIDADRTRLHLTDSDFQLGLRQDTRYGQLRLLGRKSQAIPLTSPDEFLKRVQDDYTQMVSQELPELEGQMLNRAQELSLAPAGGSSTGITQPLQDHVQELLKEPRAGLMRAYAFLDGLHAALKKEQEGFASREQELEARCRKHGRTVRSRRTEYTNQAQAAGALGPIPLGWLGLGLAAAGVPLAAVWLWVYRVLPAAGRDLLGVVLLGLLVLVAVWVLFRTFTQLSEARYAVFRAYEERLRALQDRALARAQNHLYREILDWASRLRGEVNEVSRRLIEVRAKLGTRWTAESLADTNRLSGLAANRIAESLLTSGLFTRFEKEVRAGGVEGEVPLLAVAIGTPGDWLREQADADRLGSKLESFSRERMTQALAKYDLAYLIQRLKPQELDHKVDRVQALSQAYWQHNPVRTDWDRLQARKVIALANPDQHASLVSRFGQSYSILPLADPYELIVTNVRYRFTLGEVKSFTDVLNRDYATVLQAQPDSLHTTQDRHILPDPAEPQFAIDPFDPIRLLPARDLCALAFGLRVLYEETDANQQNAVFLANAHAPELVGRSAMDIVGRVEKDARLQSKVRQATAEAYGAGGRAVLESWVANQSPRSSMFPAWALLAAGDFLANTPELQAVVA